MVNYSKMATATPKTFLFLSLSEILSSGCIKPSLVFLRSPNMANYVTKYDQSFKYQKYISSSSSMNFSSGDFFSTGKLKNVGNYLNTGNRV